VPTTELRTGSPPSRFSSLAPVAVIAATVVVPLTPALAAPAFTLFESGQVRPLTLSPDGKHLFAVNTPDNRLEIFRVEQGTLSHRGSVPVGLEPVSVAARNNDEVWVVNHLSDSVSVIDVGTPAQARVVRTLLVGDEPRDIVFAGPGRRRAFITTAHRGQNIPFDPQLTTPGVGRADVWVFDAANLGNSLGGDPLTILTLFTDTPRALAVTPDGSQVYAAGFHTGNRTTTIEPFGSVPLPGPTTDYLGVPGFPTDGHIVQFDGTHWRDEFGTSYDDFVAFSLPDKDVFVLDANANPPVQRAGPAGYFAGVGTILFNMAVNPVNGKVYVSNTEAFNVKRFEGPGIFAGSSVRGHLHESRITVLAPGSVTPRHLNKHINYGSCCAPIPNPENARSLAFPQEMAISSDGTTLYVAALGSSKIGVFDTAQLENDTFVPSTANHIPLTGGGPTGVVLNEARNQLFVLTRFDNSISIINTQTKAEVAHVPMHNPEPPSITTGRRFLYDATHSSSHGDSACASCHVFGDFDSLAWNLGNPDSTTLNNPGPFCGPVELDPDFLALKGPMSTQSLRGMANHGPMHWRGDRTGGNDAPSVQPDSGTFDEAAAFKKFQPAFVDLLGRDVPLSAAEMQAFTDFMLQVTYPPNPIRNLDNSLTAAQQAGKDFFFGPISFKNSDCNGCHVLDPNGNPNSQAPGFFGSDGRYGVNGGGAMLKVPHLRNQYQKVGMFGLPDILGPVFPGTQTGYTGDQVRGFGFFHDGGIDTLTRFLSVIRPGPDAPDGFPFGPAGDLLISQVESYMLAFDSNLAPIVGQQVTLSAANATVTKPRIQLLRARADAGECDLIAKGRWAGSEVGFLYTGGGQFRRDRQALPQVSAAALLLLAMAPGHETTFTCTPPGSGMRLGIDRDADGILDGDERGAAALPQIRAARAK